MPPVPSVELQFFLFMVSALHTVISEQPEVEVADLIYRHCLIVVARCCSVVQLSC